MIVNRHVPLESRAERPRMSGRAPVSASGVLVGEWSLRAAAWTDRHQHDEVNYVVEGELHVTTERMSNVISAGDFVVVPAGSLARYEAPVYARMVFVYGPSLDDHACTDTAYEEL